MRTLALILVIATASRSAFAADDRPTLVNLTPGQTAASLEVKAAAPAPIYTRWYFWVSIGATVAAGVATAMAISLTNTPKHYTNQEICGQACTTIN